MAKLKHVSSVALGSDLPVRLQSFSSTATFAYVLIHISGRVAAMHDTVAGHSVTSGQASCFIAATKNEENPADPKIDGAFPSLDFNLFA